MFAFRYVMLAVCFGIALTQPCWAQEATIPPSSAESSGSTNINTGLASGSVLGDNSMVSRDTGIAVNGDVQGSNLNNQQTSVSNLVLTPNTSNGGNSALVLPRNPLPMPNALLGRSNFGFQAGVQNNPSLSAFNGGSNAMGWFAQVGLNVPFGKIPDAFNSKKSNELDNFRKQQEMERRNVFGNTVNNNGDSKRVDPRVQGRVVRLSAFNYAATPSGKIPASMESALPSLSGPGGMPQPKVLALSPAEVFSQPLNTGERIGAVEIGKEYPYLGHTHSGWVKVLMPNGAEGWTISRFEYVKYDFTEIDSLALDPTYRPKQALHQPEGSTPGRLPGETSNRAIFKTPDRS